MALREELWPRDSQPQEPTAYSPSALSEFGVVGGFVVDTGYEPRLTNGAAFTNILVQAPFLPSATGNFGVATRVTDAGGGRYYTFPHGGFSSRDFTILARMRVNDVGAAGVILRTLPAGSGNTIPLWRSGTSFDMRINGTDYTAAGTFNLSRWYDIEIVGTASGCDLYVDDAVVIAGAAATAGTISSDFYFMDMANTTGWNEYGHLLFCNRALSPAERASLRANPWQLFEARRIGVPRAAGGGSQTVSIGQVAETDTAQALTVVVGGVSAALTQVQSTETAQALTPVTGTVTAITAPNEVDTAQALAVVASLSAAIGQVQSTETAQALTVATAISPALMQVQSTETAQALTVATAISPALTQVQSTETAQALTAVQPGEFTAVAETDTAQGLTVAATLTAAITQIQSTETAQILTPVLVTSSGISLALEIDAAQVLTAVGSQSAAIGQVVEVDTAQAFTAIADQSAGLGSAVEVDTAQTLVFISASPYVSVLVTDVVIVNPSLVASIVNSSIVGSLYNRLDS